MASIGFGAVDVRATTAAGGSSTTAASSSNASTSNLDGTWKITNASQVGYRVTEDLVGGLANNVAVGRTNAVTGTVTVAVRDTGEGMNSDELAHAFQRFHKGAGSRGSGLGLAIARSLVAAHGGEIGAASAPGQGTTVTFTLPRVSGS